MSDEELVVNRWRRYGKDRLYVESPDGTKIGYWDLIARSAHPESPEEEARLLAAVATWQASKAGSGPGLDATADAAAEPAVMPARVPHAAPLVLSEAQVLAPEQPARPTEESANAAARQTDLLSHNGDVVTNEPALPVSVRPWVDLATNSAGAEARERAQVARDAAPVKTVLARVLGVHTHERAWRIGADGEEKVAAQLAKVAKKDARWRFLHAVPVGSRGSDIDHVIIGPGGVFTANAKHHPDAKIWVGGNTFLVNGAKQPYVRNARHEAQRAATILSDACGFPVHVEGLIVTVNASDVVVKSQPDGVSVTPRMQVARWLLRHGDILSSATVEAIYEKARRSTTWRT